MLSAQDKEEIREQILYLKESRGKCNRCPAKPNEYWGWEAFDFDHVVGEKRFAFSQLRQNGYLGGKTLCEVLVSIADEVDKCQLLCSNCHRTVTKQRIVERKERISAKWTKILAKWA